METYKNIINSYIFQLNIWCIHDFFVFLPANHIFIMNFTADTATALGLESGKFARFAQDDENGSLYLIINSERSEDAFEIRVSSGYYYVPTKVMFDTLGYNYEDGNIMFDLIRQPSLDNDLQGLVYFMKQRQTKNKDKKNDIIEP